jgi:drug/metabolite transporter (DMT)-like permease
LKNQSKAYIYAGITIAFWSTVATAFKIGLRQLDFLHLLFFSSVFSFIILLAITFFQGKLVLLSSFKIRDYLHSATLGILNPFLYYLLIFKAYTLLPAQVAQPLNMVWPIVLVFLSVPFLKSKVSTRSYLSLLISFAGVYLISTQGKPFEFHISSPLGVALSLTSAFVWSMFWIFNMKDKREESMKLLLNFFFAIIYLFFTILLFSDFKMPSTEGLIASLYIGAFEMGFGFYFWLKALQLSTSPDKITNLVYLAPFLSLIFIHFIIGETIYFTTLAGLILIVTGIIFQKLR